MSPHQFTPLRHSCAHAALPDRSKVRVQGRLQRLVKVPILVVHQLTVRSSGRPATRSSSAGHHSRCRRRSLLLLLGPGLLDALLPCGGYVHGRGSRDLRRSLRSCCHYRRRCCGGDWRSHGHHRRSGRDWHRRRRVLGRGCNRLLFGRRRALHRSGSRCSRSSHRCSRRCRWLCNRLRGLDLLLRRRRQRRCLCSCSDELSGCLHCSGHRLRRRRRLGGRARCRPGGLHARVASRGGSALLALLLLL